MYMCVCIYIYVCVCVCIYLTPGSALCMAGDIYCVCVYVCIYVCVYICVRVYVCICISHPLTIWKPMSVFKGNHSVLIGQFFASFAFVLIST
ncbi:hypothetical protein FKM82_030675 [Ascaphus truei]